ncbi:hypothetical protein MMC13_004033 [Lambiella insularis]|nr:hypothetical protein [Lambiella insularis]
MIFYLTLSEHQQIFRWMTWANLAVVNIAGLALTFLNIFQCSPVGAAFIESVPSGAICTDIVTLYLSSAPVNIITDLAILFLPMPILTGLRLPVSSRAAVLDSNILTYTFQRRQKIILLLTFGFGAFATAVDVVRIAYLQSAFEIRLQEVRSQSATTSRRTEQDDFSWYASLSFMWSAIEVHTGIICACVPALKPLAAKIIPSILRDTSDPKDTSQLDFGDRNASKLATNPSFGLGSPPSSPLGPPPAALRGNQEGMDTMDFLTTPDMLESMTDPSTVAGGTANETRAQSNLPEKEGAMDMMDFLTTPDAPRHMARAPTVATIKSRTGSMSYLDFYNMNDNKPMTKLSNKESVVPIALVTILFFLWGFAYGLLDTLNSQFQRVAGTTSAQGVGLHAAYYGAYFFGPLTVGRFVFLRWGFKATFITGLCIYGAGTLVFWPSAVLTSFPAFLVSNFLVGFGVSILEVAANPYVALCGPPQYAEIRLNLSQGVQAIGTVIAPLLAQRVLFTDVQAPNLVDTQWAYLAIALFDVVLAVAFYYMPIPEASDEDFDDVAEKRHAIYNRKVFNIPVTYVTLALGVFSIWCYVGGQEAVGSPFQSYISVVAPKSALDPFNYSVIGHTAFAAGRFLSALFGMFIRPSDILLFLTLGMLVTSALTMSQTGNTSIAMIILCQFFESGIFPILYATALRGLGSYTKTGSVYLAAAISGGAIFPAIMHPVSNAFGLPYSFCIIVAASAFGTIYPLYLIFVPAARDQVNPGRKHRHPALPDHRPVSPYKKASRVFQAAMRRKRGPDEGCGAEHVEGEKEEWPG